MTAIKPFPKTFILHPQLQAIIQDLDDCIDITSRTKQPHCMSLTGPSGSGKSTLLEYLQRRHPRREASQGAIIPFLTVPLPSTATVKATATETLKALGDPNFQKGTGWNRDIRLFTLLPACQVDCVAYDDFHHLLNRETDRIRETVSEWLKELIKRTGKVFLVVCVDDTVDRVLASNPQLSRLFTVRRVLQPFAWLPGQLKQPFVEFTSRAVVENHLEFAVELPQLELYHRLHNATDGLVGHTMSLVYRLRKMTEISHGQVNLDLLQQAYDRELAAVVGKPNPFLVSG